MKTLGILSLNCQRGHQVNLGNFLKRILKDELYDVLLLQEVDASVLPFLEHSSYNIIRVMSENGTDESELCIAYRNTYTLLGQGFQSFTSMHTDPWRTFRHTPFGILWCDLEVEGTKVRVGSIHLHSGINALTRFRELALAKKLLLKDISVPTLFAGDFNAGYPGEAHTMARKLKPEFTWTTKRAGPTLNSFYTEHGPHLFNKVARLLASVHLGFRFRTDHFFSNHQQEPALRVTCRVLSDRVSDHSPVELRIDSVEV